MPRPNVAPRPTCRYFTTSRGCFAGTKCHYLHADPTYAPYEENKTCRFFKQGYCKRGSECWFKHVEPEAEGEDKEVQRPLDEEDMACGICFDDKPVLYGLLIGCSHAFCLTCIRQWRDPDGKGTDLTDAGIHKTCPMCRLQTKFIIPSSILYGQGDPRKEVAVEKYRLSMAKVPCRYFVNSPPDERYCPFGKDCFYQHQDADGRPFVFMDGVDVMMTRRRRRRTYSQSAPDPLQAALEVLEGFAETLASDSSSDTRRAVIDMHVREMLRIMGHAPALRTLETLERMAGTDEQEEEESDEEEAGGPTTGQDVRTGDAVVREGEETMEALTTLWTARSIQDARPATEAVRAASAPPHFEPSQDPRAPHNAARSSGLVSGDFAWMMDERQAGTLNITGAGATQPTRPNTSMLAATTSTAAITTTTPSRPGDDECTHEV